MRRTSTIREALDRLNNLPDRRKLDEDLKGYFKNNYMKVFGEIPEGPADAKKKAEKSAYDKALKVAKLDPTFKGREIANPEEALNKDKGSYFDWLMRMIKKNVITFDDMMAHGDEFTDQLLHFDIAKKRNKLPADSKDIMRFKTLAELAELINSLGADINAEEADASTFKGAVSNIRGALQSICGFKNEEIPQNIQKTEDALTLVCETNAWECWRINSIWGAMLADTYGIDWGGGATWCTGGQYGLTGSPRKGANLLASAQRFYPNYTGNGNVLHFFQQKDNNVRRPQNKAQFQVKNNYEVANFFHANDSSIGLNNDGTISYNGGWGHDTSEVMSAFITQNGLLDAMKKSSLKGIEPIADAENMARLEAGEPYIYNGGKIKASFIPNIRVIKFEHNGKEYTVEVSGGNDNIFKCQSTEEMFNLLQVREGKPYVYNGGIVPQYIAPEIREIVFDENFHHPASSESLYRRYVEDGSIDGEADVIVNNAFKGCVNCEKITIPVSVVGIGFRTFNDIPDTAHLIYPRYPDRPLKCQPQDVEHLKKIIYYDDGTRPAWAI